MDIQISRNGSMLAVRLIGQFWDRRDVEGMEGIAVREVDASTKRVAVNLERLTFIDSAGIGAIVKTSSLLRKKNISLVLVNPLGSVQETLSLAGIGAVVRIVESEDEAAVRECESPP